ncbi:MAG: helicase-related protein [Candidatus Paceibacterota bacterium]|jgi:superfamily II DNA or RNA helicase/HKD family nuclease
MKNFITNSNYVRLKKRIIDLIEKSDELKFLVGFFYFSGIRELYEGLKDNPDVKIKVLVGLDVDKTNHNLIEYADDHQQVSDEEKSYRFFQSVKKSINSNEFDTKEFYEQVRYFIKLIKDDRLIIRKTYHPNHAKLYIFKLMETQIARNQLFITGSSNLTKAGLTTQAEFNVEISDYGVEDAEEYFDHLWDEAVPITEHNETRKKLIETIENETLITEITPFEAFVLILKTYLSSFEYKNIGESVIDTLKRNNYKVYQYQLDAVKQALAIIEKNNGVIIADVVGLGKTIIACAVAKQLRKRGVIICPPGIMGDKNKTSGWQRYQEEFGLYDWEVRSCGDLENIAKFIKDKSDIEIVIIDEAHRFRNQDTKGYELLKNICRNKIVILLTATPFNNRPGDILSLLNLFIIPKKSIITLEDNIINKFRHFKIIFDRLGYIKKYHNSSDVNKKRKAESFYEKLFEEKGINLIKVQNRAHYLAKQIRDVIEPVIIRRNRLDLQNNPFYQNEVTDLSIIDDPKEWFFELTKEQSRFYDEVIQEYFADPDDGGQFKGAIYRPFEYEIKREKISEEKLSEKENFQFIQQKNLYEFMRRLLVKRFESSFGSFKQSVKNFIKITEDILKFIEKTDKYILDRSLLEKIYNKEIEDIEKELVDFSEKLREGDYPKNSRIYEINKFAHKEEFITDVKSDLRLLKDIFKRLSILKLDDKDPKVDCLIENLREIFSRNYSSGEPKRKVIIFSEYVDTVNYLTPILKDVFGERVLIIAGDLSARKVKEINRNFDASHAEPQDDYDILLASDKISEGFNLNRAGIVINYDIPWNPVRVIQRVGRINRISKKVFDNLYIVNFFPTEKGASVVKSREIAQNKMFLIHNTLGEDAKIFDIDEEPTASGLYNKIQQNPDKLQEESFYTMALREFTKIEKQYPDIVERIKKFSPRIKVAKLYNENELIVLIKKRRIHIKSISNHQKKKQAINDLMMEDIFEKVKCNKKEKSMTLSNHFWDAYERIKNPKKESSIPNSEQSIEQKALNNLKTFISKPWDGLFLYLDFIRTLLEDINDYGTLADYTLRRIANLDSLNEKQKKQTADEIRILKEELGEDYLQKEKDKQISLHKEIIIAVENQNYE